MGFCGSKTDHICITNCRPSVGEEATGYNNLIDTLKEYKIALFARVIIANMLYEKLLKFVLVVCATCNCFDSDWVRNQWQRIDELWEQHCEYVIGPMIGHASNGDSRCKQLMLSYYKSKDGTRFAMPWDG